MVYSVIVGNYVINKQEIVDKFCVNKAMPEMQCDGKCYLAQQLQEEKEKKNGESQHFFSLDFGLYVSCDTPNSLSEIGDSFDTIHFSIVNDLLVDVYIPTVKTPPKA